MATILTVNEHLQLKKYHCDKSKHRFRENKFGVTWCTICGLLSSNTYGLIKPLEENDKLVIKCNNDK